MGVADDKEDLLPTRQPCCWVRLACGALSPDLHPREWNTISYAIDQNLEWVTVADLDDDLFRYRVNAIVALGSATAAGIARFEERTADQYGND